MLVPGRLLADPYKAYAFIQVLPEIRDYGRLLAAPTGRIRSSGYFLKSGVTGGFYPLLVEHILYNFIFIETHFAFCFG